MREIALALVATMAAGFAAAQIAPESAPQAVVAPADAAASFAQRSAAAPVTDAVQPAATHQARPAAVQPDLLPTSTVPEPGTYALLAAGLGVVFFVSRRRRRQD